MSADVRFAANSGPIDWPLSALCCVPLAAEGSLLGRGIGSHRGTRALALRALRQRVAAERQGSVEAPRQAAADCAGSLWGRKRSSVVAARTDAMGQEQKRRSAMARGLASLSGDDLALGLFVLFVGRWRPGFLLLLDLNLHLNDRHGRWDQLASGGRRHLLLAAGHGGPNRETRAVAPTRRLVLAFPAPQRSSSPKTILNAFGREWLRGQKKSPPRVLRRVRGGVALNWDRNQLAERSDIGRHCP
jgi:hypothetical protein